MKRQIFAALLVLMLVLSGCSEASTVPTENSELVTETEEIADTEGTSSPFLSESKESDAPEEAKSPESTVAPETEATEPPKEENKPKETTSAVTTPEKTQSDPAHTTTPTPAKPVETEAPKETPKPAETTPQPTPEEVNPKSAYDFEFDIEAIKADCLGIGQGMGLNLDTSLTPSNAASWNPVTASQNSQGTALKQSLESYIKLHTVENLGSCGIDAITDFNIYCEARGNSVYSIYFLFA